MTTASAARLRCGSGYLESSLWPPSCSRMADNSLSPPKTALCNASGNGGASPLPTSGADWRGVRWNYPSTRVATSDTVGMDIDPPIMGYYGRGREQDRLFIDPVGVLERLRTWDLLERVLPAGGTVLDVGGAAGVHAAWLAERGYDVELFDPVPLHVTQARELARSLPKGQRFNAELADARAIPRESDSADAVLLFGPLYHLLEAADRRTALGEARRLLRPGGVLVAAAVSRFAWPFDAYRQQIAADPAIQDSITYSLETGRSVRTPGPDSFWAYFHRPDELEAEICDAGFHAVSVHGVGGFAWLLPDLGDILADSARRDDLLALLRRIETETGLLGVSSHLLAVARTPPANHTKDE